MMRTPATKIENKAQKVRKSLEPQEEITINIVKTVTGSYLVEVLAGVAAFTKSFKENDKFQVTIKVEKKIEEIIAAE
jgi:hypothetical protein